MHTETLINLNKKEVTNISKFYWDCYGKNAYYMDLKQTSKNGVYEDFVMVYDCITNKVYHASYYHSDGIAFNWYAHDTRQAYFDEAFLRSDDPQQCTEEINWVELNQTDFLLNIEKVLNGHFSDVPRGVPRTPVVKSTLDDEWDTSEVQLNLSSEELESLKTIAIENELTMSQLVTQILEVQLAERKV